MHKIITIKDHNNHEKIDFYEKLRRSHQSMTGKILNKSPIIIGEPLRFLWADDSKKILATSTVTGYMRSNDIVQVVTQNSIYILERVSK